MRKPTVQLKCPANAYTNSAERIVEFSNGATSESQLQGGLISFRRLEDGRLLVNIYRCDAGVIVRTSQPTI